MGFFWSQPAYSPDSSLHTSLLDEEPELIFQSGDLLLVASNEMQIVLLEEPWSHVAVVVKKENKVYAFSNGVYEPIHQYLYRHGRVACRPLQCARDMGFDNRVRDAADRAAEMLLMRTDIDISFREGHCVGLVLAILGLVDLVGLAKGPVTPMHFCGGTPFPRLKLFEYSAEHWIIGL